MSESALRKALLNDPTSVALAMQQFTPREQTYNLNGHKVKNLRYCHSLVRDTAKALASEIYERAMSHNENYTAWAKLCVDLPRSRWQAEWTRLMWPRMLDDARATLARLLASGINEGLKKQIYEALLADREIRGERSVKPLFRA